MLKFLYGRPGSGKTSYIIKEIEKSVKAGKRTYLLVPEQQVFTTEAMLSTLPPSSGILFETVSFSRLCEIVFSIVGGLCESRMGSGMRNLIMWQIIREMSPTFREYRPKNYGQSKSLKPDKAMASMMLSVIDELRASGKTASDCEKLVKKLDEFEDNSALAGKLSDISAVYQGFDIEIEKLFGESAKEYENRLVRLKETLISFDIFADCDFYVDSFTSFTGVEHAILEEIIKQADNFCISFCLDKGGNKAKQNESIEYTVSKFTEFANSAHINAKEVQLSVPEDSKSPALLRIEDKIWDFSVKKSSLPDIKRDDSLILASCKNELEEAKFAALQIIRAKNEGIKYSEIAVIARDCESRKGIIDAVFSDMNIPYFYSQKTNLSVTPVCRLLLSALRCIVYNFRSEDVLTLIKTGLSGTDVYDADLFEEYCYTWSITNSKFLEPWSMNPDGYVTKMSKRGSEILVSANKVRQQVISPLVSLRNKFALNNGDTKENCRALYEYLQELNISDTLGSLAENALKSGDIKEAGELIRVYDLLISILTDISLALSDYKTSPEELCTAIEIMLSNTEIGSVPAVNDCVTVGSASTLRVENIKLTIVLGLNEGEFPQNYSDSGLLTETDKKTMAKYDLALDSREDRIISDELFYVYRAMTKPSKRLVISSLTSSIGGKAMNPSTAWNRVRFLLPEFAPIVFDLKKLEMSLIEASCDSSLKAVNSEDECALIDPQYVRMIFGDILKLTKSKIATFAECPYKYWCKYVLKLREIKISEISYADSGTIIHYILENFLKMESVRNEDGSITRPSHEDTKEAVTSILKQYIDSIDCPKTNNLTYQFSRLRDLSLVMVENVLDEFEASKFKIVAMEKNIDGSVENSLKPMEIQVYDDKKLPVVNLGGTVDRIDIYDDGNQKYLRIVDYKTGAHKFDVKKVSTGTDLQLPAYLFTAALKDNYGFYNKGDGEVDTKIQAASALFLSANEKNGEIFPERSGFILNEKGFLEAVNKDFNRKMLAGIMVTKKGEIKGNAAVSMEEIDNIDSTLRASIKTCAQNMYSGKAPRKPSSDACMFCPMKSTCHVAYKDKY